MRVAKLILVVEPGTGSTSKLVPIQHEDSVYSLWHTLQALNNMEKAQVGWGSLQNMAMHQTLEC